MGFIHPSQFASLSEEADTPPADEIVGSKETALFDSTFWSRDHRLGIATCVILPLYGAAKHAFMSALQKYKMHKDILSQSISETELMKHSRSLLLLSCDFGTAWNSRFSSYMTLSNTWIVQEKNYIDVLYCVVLSF